MKPFAFWSVGLLAAVAADSAQAMPLDGRPADETVGLVQRTGNTSSNSSSNTSSNSSSTGSSYIHTHRWSVDSDDGRRRRSTRGTTRIERYAPAPRQYRQRRDGRGRWDDDD